MKSNLIAHIVILTLLLVSTANSFAFACLESVSVESEIVETMGHTESDCHSEAMSAHNAQSIDDNVHCEQLCFCEQAANSPQTFIATPFDSSFDGFPSSKYAPVQNSALSINIKPPTPPPTLFKLA